MTVVIEDNGCGMIKTVLQKLKTLFLQRERHERWDLASRFLSLRQKACGGSFLITSEVGKRDSCESSVWLQQYRPYAPG